MERVFEADKVRLATHNRLLQHDIIDLHLRPAQLQRCYGIQNESGLCLSIYGRNDTGSLCWPLMSFSSRRRNYLLTPHRRDGLIEWMKSMLQHSFVLDALEVTADDTFRHFEMLIEEHRNFEEQGHQGLMLGGHERHGSQIKQSRLRQLVPTIGSFHTALPLREAFHLYNEKHRLVCSLL